MAELHVSKREFDPGSTIELNPDGINQINRRKSIENINELGQSISLDEITITTQTEDSTGDIIYSDGGSIDDYMRNPVVGWNHGGAGKSSIDYPIAKTMELSLKSNSHWDARFEWAPWGISEDVDIIHRLWNARIIFAASVWIKIEESEPREGFKESFFPPLNIYKWKMKEWSLVYVPANQDAVRKGLDPVRNTFRFCMKNDEYSRIRRRAFEDARKHAEQEGLRNVVVPFDTSELNEKLSRLNTQTQQLKEVIKHGRQRYPSSA